MEHTSKLIEQENRTAYDRLKVVASVINQVEEIFIKENFTLSEWTQVIEYFNKLNEAVIPQMSISELKVRFNKINYGNK